MSTTLGVVPQPTTRPAVKAATHTPTPPRFTDLDGIRALAALLIVVFHAWQFDGGTDVAHAPGGRVLGMVFGNSDALVGLFFVLSAFVLWRPVVAGILADRRPTPPRPWLVRRAVRIVPLYWFVITVVWVSRNPGLPGDWRDLLEHLTFTQVFDNKRIFYTVGPAWSLAVEVMVYLLMALTLTAVTRLDPLRVSRRWRLAAAASPIVVLVGLCPAVMVYQVVIGHAPSTDEVLFFGPFAWGTAFGGGLLLAFAHVAWGERTAPRALLATLAALGVASLIVTGAYRFDGAGQLALFRVVSGFALTALMAALIFAPRKAAIRRCLGRPIMVWGGALSYGLYLWHEPVLLVLANLGIVHQVPSVPVLVVTMSLLVATSVPVAWISYTLLERPAQLLPRLAHRYHETRAEPQAVPGRYAHGYVTEKAAALRSPVRPSRAG